MQEKQLAARLAEIDEMEARVKNAPNKEDAIAEELFRLLNERDAALNTLESVRKQVQELPRHLGAAHWAQELLRTLSLQDDTQV